MIDTVRRINFLSKDKGNEVGRKFGTCRTKAPKERSFSALFFIAVFLFCPLRKESETCAEEKNKLMSLSWIFFEKAAVFFVMMGLSTFERRISEGC